MRPLMAMLAGEAELDNMTHMAKRPGLPLVAVRAHGPHVVIKARRHVAAHRTCRPPRAEMALMPSVVGMASEPEGALLADGA